MIIRKMTIEDLPQVCAIEQDSFSQPWGEDDFKNALLNSNNSYLVCDQESTIIGYTGYWGIVGEGDIYNVAVKKDCRNQGVGFQLLKALISEAKSRGITALALEVRSSNHAARHLYHALGFEEAGIRKDFYEKPKEDAVIMWLKPIQ